MENYEKHVYSLMGHFTESYISFLLLVTIYLLHKIWGKHLVKMFILICLRSSNHANNKYTFEQLLLMTKLNYKLINNNNELNSVVLNYFFS